MIFKGLLTDRNELVKALEKMTGETATYSGAPSFRYQIGIYTVLRDGKLDAPEDAPLIGTLAARGFIEIPHAPNEAIVLPMDGVTGRTMTNLVMLFTARERLINKAIGIPNAFHMKAGLARRLREERPVTLPQFMDILEASGGEKSIRGLHISGGQIAFIGFPNNDTCRILAEHILSYVKVKKSIRSVTPEVTSEKYSFRDWLNKIGLSGPEYKQVRKELLKNMSGSIAYRTVDMKKAYDEKLRANKKEQKPDFILLR